MDLSPQSYISSNYRQFSTFQSLARLLGTSRHINLKNVTPPYGSTDTIHSLILSEPFSTFFTQIRYFYKTEGTLSTLIDFSIWRIFPCVFAPPRTTPPNKINAQESRVRTTKKKIFPEIPRTSDERDRFLPFRKPSRGSGRWEMAPWSGEDRSNWKERERRKKERKHCSNPRVALALAGAQARRN